MRPLSVLPVLPDKLFFRIGEVAGLVGVEPHVLRYWEREFRSIRPTKSKKGQRVYSRKDVENLFRVRDLLYREGFTIAGAKKKLQRGAGFEPDAVDGPVVSDAPPNADEVSISASAREAPHAARAPRTDSAHSEVRVPAPKPSKERLRMREQLHALRDEIERFLLELDESGVRSMR